MGDGKQGPTQIRDAAEAMLLNIWIEEEKHVHRLREVDRADLRLGVGTHHLHSRAASARLELRLDNVVWRLGLTSTRRAARQMVAHGHVMVGEKKVRVPSHMLAAGDTLAIREGSKAHGMLVGFAEKFAERPLPSWLSWDPKTMKGSVTASPTASSADVAGDLVAVLSFYTR